MEYIISYKEPHKQLIDIELQINNITTPTFYLQLPAWRPGRYELQNYSRNIKKLEVFASNGEKLDCRKIRRERWEVQTKHSDKIIVRYNCYCRQMDAGGVWLDENQLYLNFIYCLIYGIGKENEPCTVELKIPDNYKIACGLPEGGRKLKAGFYFQLADSPMIASPNLLHQTYEAEGVPFNIWIEGEVQPDWNKIINDFKRFSEECIRLFGEFPEKEYHFLYQVPHYRQYHGVEHSNSTIITLGPAENFNSQTYYENFLGISCHELFHAWNALKIRPKEMVPYDLTRENYFRTGYIIEGVTTYYGDLLLMRSGVFSTDQYFKEVNTLFQKHFDNFGRFNLSVADSSFDLWVDGYSAGIPNRKVSIYDKGAVIAMILDLELRRITGNSKSLDDVMKLMWTNFGKNISGYTEEDYQSVVENVAGQSMQDYFTHCVYGLDPVEEKLNNALKYVGCELLPLEAITHEEKVFGFKSNCKDNRIFVDLIEPGSPADKVLSKGDEIIAINGETISIPLDSLIATKQYVKLSLVRHGKLIEREVEADGKTYLRKYIISKRADASDSEKENFSKWLNASF